MSIQVIFLDVAAKRYLLSLDHANGVTGYETEMTGMSISFSPVFVSQTQTETGVAVAMCFPPGLNLTPITSMPC